MTKDELVAHLRRQAQDQSKHAPERARLLEEMARILSDTGIDMRADKMLELEGQLSELHRQEHVLRLTLQSLGDTRRCSGCGALQRLLVGIDIPHDQEFVSRCCGHGCECESLYCPGCSLTAEPECFYR